jgi:benzylsuccinate CoA-transferase BbsF subunit
MALEGIRVVDFTWVVAGPVATRMLADNGAQVIKVERKSPGYMGPRKIGLQPDLNRNKLSVAINMAEPRGNELARRLVMMSDLVIDNFSARVMRAWGMDYESLRKLKPDIICMSMSGLGHTGPRRDYVSYGPTLQALTGFVRLMTEPGGAPAGFGYSFSDLAGGMAGGFVALAALWHRRRTGQGQFIDLSQMEALTGFIGPCLLDIAVNGRQQEPVDWRAQERPAAPYGVYRCRPEGADDDRWIVISVGTQAEWERFAGALGNPAWTAEPRFRTLYLRMRNRDELDRRVGEWTANCRAEEAMALLQRAGVSAGLVQNGADLCTRDPQLRHRGYWSAVPRPGAPDTYVGGIPYRLARTPGSIRANCPEVGEHNEYVLGELLGLSPAQREELYAANVVWR